MIGYIVFAEDIEVFREEIELKKHLIDVLDSNRLRIVHNGAKSVCLIKGCREELSQLESVEIIGECVGDSYDFYSEDARLKYESVRDLTPVRYVDDAGQERVLVPPYMIGVFS